MCLDTKSNKKFKVEKVNGLCVGYMWREKDYKSNLFSLLKSYKRNPIGKWLHEKNFRFSRFKNSNFINAGNFHYPFGWHIYVNKNEAISSGFGDCDGRVLRMVFFDKIVAYGTQKSRKVVIAKEIFIIQAKYGGIIKPQ